MGFYREAFLGVFFIFFIIFVFSVFSVALSAMNEPVLQPAQQNPLTAPLVSEFIMLWNKTPLVLIFGSFIAIIVAAFYYESQQRRVM